MSLKNAFKLLWDSMRRISPSVCFFWIKSGAHVRNLTLHSSTVQDLTSSGLSNTDVSLPAPPRTCHTYSSWQVCIEFSACSESWMSEAESWTSEGEKFGDRSHYRIRKSQMGSKWTKRCIKGQGRALCGRIQHEKGCSQQTDDSFLATHAHCHYDFRLISKANHLTTDLVKSKVLHSICRLLEGYGRNRQWNAVCGNCKVQNHSFG